LARKVLTATSTAVDFMLPDRRWKRLVRDRLILPLMRVPAVQRRVWLAASQRGISYRGGPLAQGAGALQRRPRPGDRVPDLPCRHLDGSEATLHAAICGRWVVVAPERARAERYAAAAAGLLGADAVHALVPVLGIRRSVWLNSSRWAPWLGAARRDQGS
jgi:4,5-epoxidase